MFRKKILFVVSILATCGFLFWRTNLVGKCIEPLNGFFYPDANTYRYLFILVFFLLAAVVFLISLTDKKFPKRAVTSSKMLGVLNILYSFAAFAQFGILFKGENDKFENIYVIAVFILGLFMIYYGICEFLGKRISKASALIPLLVFVYKLGYVFVNSFGIIKSSEVVLNIFALIFCILFFECFARYNASIKFDFVKKPFLALGAFTPVVMITSTLGGILAPMFFNITSRTNPTDSLLLIATAVYIYLYTVIIFSNKSVYKA